MVTPFRQPLETTDEQLVEAAEQMDAGIRLAGLHPEQMLPAPEPATEPNVEAGQLALERMLEAKEKWLEAMAALDCTQERAMHVSAAELLDGMAWRIEAAKERFDG